MEDDLVKRVARAIAEARAVPGTKPAKPAPWSSDVDKRAALAAIEAIREPTQAMLSALLAVIHRDGGQHQDAVGVKQAWEEAMQLSSERLPAAA